MDCPEAACGKRMGLLSLDAKRPFRSSLFRGLLAQRPEDRIRVPRQDGQGVRRDDGIAAVDTGRPFRLGQFRDLFA